MGIENKVLTVSYDTFSCTLEGFTDSFGAMKAIAEYFRDLASDDRYFAANPPDLDPGIISELASRNSSQKLTARTQGTNVVLSPAEPKATEPSNSSPKEPVQETTLTERVKRIKALANRGTFSDDENEQTKIWPTNEVLQGDPVENFFADHEVIPPPRKEKSASYPAPPPLTISAEQETQATPDVSTKIPARTSEVQAESQNPMDLQPTGTAQKPLEIIFDDLSSELTKGRAQNDPAKTDAPNKALDEPRPEPAEVPTDLPKNGISEGSSEVAQSAAPTSQPAAVSLANSLQKSVDLPPAPSITKPVVKVIRKSVVAKQEQPFEGPKPVPDDTSLQASETENQIQPAESTARATKVPPPLTDVETPTRQDTQKSSFEDNLSEMLSLNSTKLEDVKQNNPKETQPARLRQHFLRQEHQDVSRLLKQTDQKMAHPGQSRRRNALAHLRAAVAANRGEHPTDLVTNDILKMSTSTNLAAQTSLSQEVSPVENNDRPMPKPLRLVEDQRVDGTKVAAAAIAENNSIEAPIDFATYAERVKATTLEAQIEAAASYLSLVLKRETFARRNVFGRTREVSKSPFMRRTYMGIFNALIEQGKVKALEDGTYEICKDKIGYQLPDQILH
ncbi:MAG: hypothetical protein EVA86_00250 [Rhodobacteraceae bacterium]|nr:MAG: hypothetical protein EVA86_00250 [Paracoccaceae bacterium]